jgi:hypothetical protein
MSYHVTRRDGLVVTAPAQEMTENLKLALIQTHNVLYYNPTPLQLVNICPFYPFVRAISRFVIQTVDWPSVFFKLFNKLATKVALTRKRLSYNKYAGQRGIYAFYFATAAAAVVTAAHYSVSYWSELSSSVW